MLLGCCSGADWGLVARCLGAAWALLGCCLGKIPLTIASFMQACLIHVMFKSGHARKIDS
eukprot:11224578-Lingulodinium_polyedra.AAC.1